MKGNGIGTPHIDRHPIQLSIQGLGFGQRIKGMNIPNSKKMNKTNHPTRSLVFTNSGKVSPLELQMHLVNNFSFLKKK